jgi:ABC-type branched-subunit amino acid transport system ATPase component
VHAAIGSLNGERINGIDPDKIVRRGIFQVMEGRRISADITSLENLRSAPLPAAIVRSAQTSTVYIISRG